MKYTQVQYCLLCYVLCYKLFMYCIYIGITDADVEDADIIDATNVAANVTNSICQVDFATINNQPVTSAINMATHTTKFTVTTNSASSNGTVDSPQSATVAVLVISIVGGILGFCIIIIIICIVGLLVIKNKAKKGNITKENFAQQLSTSVFNRYVHIYVCMLYFLYSRKVDSREVWQNW